MTTTVEIGLQPHQHAAVTCESPRLLMSGAYGSGKTYPLCVKAVLHAQHKGNLVALFRKKLFDLRQTTLRTLLVGEGGVPPVLPEGTYDHNKSNRTISIHGGGTIYYTGLDKETRLGSLNLGWAGVDEAIEITKDDAEAIAGRLRNDTGPYRQLFLVCNPGSRSHWIYVDFIEPFEEKVDEQGVRWHGNGEDIATIMSSTADNQFLPVDYHERLKKMSAQARQRYYEGKWVTFEGLVYDTFDRSIHVQERKGPWERVLVGVDEGYTNPAVMSIVGFDGAGLGHIISEYYKSGVLQDRFIEVATLANQKYGPEWFVVDPSAAELIASMRSAGLPVKAANNAVFSGIQRVQQRLAGRAAHNVPMLTVEPTCTNHIKEFEAYMWKPGKDAPEKQFDHAMDALRYVMAEVDPAVRFDIFLPGDEEEDIASRVVRELGLTAGIEADDSWLRPDNDELFS